MGTQSSVSYMLASHLGKKFLENKGLLRGMERGDDRALHRQLSWSSNGWRAIATLAEIGQASLVGRIPEGEVMLCGAATARSRSRLTRLRLSKSG